MSDRHTLRNHRAMTNPHVRLYQDGGWWIEPTIGPDIADPVKVGSPDRSVGREHAVISQNGVAFVAFKNDFAAVRASLAAKKEYRPTGAKP